MDVRCAKCGIEYEFDDAKVTAAGVTVKCTSCGHVFKVKREEPSLPSPPVTGSFAGDGEWMVRQPGGSIYRFKELTTLQKWIVERKVSRHDEISKTGRTWKPLGDVAELASFFQVVDAANAALQASLVAVQPPMRPSEAPVAGGAGMRPGAPAVQHTDPDLGTPLPSPTSPLPTGAVPPMVAAVPPPSAPSVPVRPRTEALPQGPDALDALDGLDEDDPVLAWQRTKRRRLMAATVVLVVAALAAAGFTFRDQLRALVDGGTTALAPATLDAAAAALQGNRAAPRATAKQAIDAAAAAPTPPPLALAWQARLEIADAAEAREVARVEQALAAMGGPDAAKHEAAAGDAAARADQALAHAYRVVGDVRALAPRLPEAHLAAAAYQLERGGLPEMKGDLEAARQAATPEALPAIDAEIAVHQALADARGALASTDAAVLAAAAERVPRSADGRLRDAHAALLALAQAARVVAKAPADPAALDAAKAAVRALPDADERVRRYGALLDAVAAANATPVLVDAGPVAQLDAGPAPAADAGIADVDDSPNDGYDVVMQKAERARVNGRSKLAHLLFLKATKQKPTAPRPWLGLGWAAMDLGRNAEAVRAFKRAVELAPEVGEAHFGLAEALRFTGQSAQAVAEYQEFLRIDPGSRDADVAKRAIDSIKE